MEPSRRQLGRALRKLARRRQAARWLRLSGVGLFLWAVLLCLLFGVRRYLLDFHGVDPLPFAPIPLAAGAAAAILATLGLLRASLALVRPRRAAIARALDGGEGLSDLVASAVSVRDRTDPFSQEVVRRAAREAEKAEPERVFPARRSLLGSLAVVPLVLAALYLFSLPPWRGVDPFRRAPVTPAEPAAAAGREETPSAPEPEDDPRAEPPQDDPGAEAPEPAPPPEEPDRIGVALTPMKKVYERTDPVTLFVHAKGAPARREHVLFVSIAVDGEAVAIDEKIRVGPEGGEVLTVLGRTVGELSTRLTPGKHQVAAILDEGDRAFASAPVTIEIRGDPDAGGGGGGGASPPPPPPPPETEAKPRYVLPLFGPGETVEKKGIALVPDPEAPPGTPPRRLPMAEAAREAGRRPESLVPRESVAPRDRETVTRYFDLLKDAR